MAGAKGAKNSQGFGRCRGGGSTKFHATVNDESQSIKPHLTEGEYHDLTCAEVLLEGLESRQLIADKGYGNDLMGQRIRSAGAKPVISSRRNCLSRRHDCQGIGSETWCNGSLTDLNITVA